MAAQSARVTTTHSPTLEPHRPHHTLYSGLLFHVFWWNLRILFYSGRGRTSGVWSPPTLLVSQIRISTRKSENRTRLHLHHTTAQKRENSLSLSLIFITRVAPHCVNTFLSLSPDPGLDASLVARAVCRDVDLGGAAPPDGETSGHQKKQTAAVGSSCFNVPVSAERWRAARAWRS